MAKRVHPVTTRNSYDKTYVKCRIDDSHLQKPAVTTRTPNMQL
jgi:hypothetical protein